MAFTGADTLTIEFPQVHTLRMVRVFQALAGSDKNIQTLSMTFMDASVQTVSSKGVANSPN